MLPTLPAQVAFERPDRIGAGGDPADRSDPDEPLVPSEPAWDASLPSPLDSFLSEADERAPANSVPEEAPAPARVAPPEPASPRTTETSSRAVTGSFDQPPVAPRASATDAFS